MIPKLDWRALLRVATRNWFWKVASIAFAIGLWGFVNLGAREADRSLTVPLEAKNLPPRLTVTNPIPEGVNVRLRGPRTILGTVDERRQRIVLDLASIGAGTTSYRIDGEMLNLPRGVRVTRISPGQVTFDIEAVIDKPVPVALNFGGATPNGFRIVDGEIRPAVVTVTGPAGLVNRLKSIPTGPLHLSATTGSFEEFVTLERPGDAVRLSPDRVTVRGRLEEATITQDFKNVEIGVRKAPDRYQLSPRNVD
ncbi:MAG: CdaR family protein, partial [Candidatus Binatia bacterium]